MRSRTASTVAGDAGSTETARVFVALSIAFLVTVLIRTAWIADDAAIELRVVENFVAGLGLRWNIAERVQAYTDPLWVLLVSAVDFVVRQPYVSVWALSVVLTIGAVATLALLIATDAAAALMAIAILTFSKSFVEYSASGFQTPLTVVLLTAFWAAYWRPPPGPRQLVMLASLTALCVLTEPLAVLLLLPALGVAASRVERGRRTGAMLVGFAPIAAWLLFAAVYYGFLLPNAATAAWHSPWPLREMLRQGGYYLLDAANNDPVAVMTIAVAAASAAFGTIAGGMPVVAGILMFVAALVVSGGDSLSGRSLVPPLVSAVVLVARYPWRQFEEFVVAPLAVVVVLGLATPAAPVLADEDFGRSVPAWNRWPGDPAPKPTEVNHIRDERRLSYQTSGLLKAQRYVPLPDTSQTEATVNAALKAGRHVLEDDRIGLLGIVAGPRLHVVDPRARGDALLARLSPREPWRPGGARRDVPSGYLESLETHQNRIGDPELRRYFDALSLVTTRPLFSRERLRAIVEVNLRGAPR